MEERLQLQATAGRTCRTMIYVLVDASIDVVPTLAMNTGAPGGRRPRPCLDVIFITTTIL